MLQLLRCAMLWIGLCLPSLPLETFAATLPETQRDQPVVLTDGPLVVAANAAARQFGVKAGMQRATASTFASRLLFGTRDDERDREAWMSVAHAALAFTPAVTLVGPDDAFDPTAQPRLPYQVLMDVQASLRYFGGIDALIERLQQSVARLGHRMRIATAPTAHGASLLSRCPGPPPRCADLDALRQALDAAPIWLIGPGREHWDSVQRMGLRTIGDLRRLPRSGVARRFSEDLLDEIDWARGDKPDPRPWLVPPPVFESRLELFGRADSTEPVLAGAQVLLTRLAAWAAARQAHVGRYTLVMAHEGRRRIDGEGGSEGSRLTALEVALALPSGDAAHLHNLLRERLAAVKLAAPVIELKLHCADLAAAAEPNGELFPTPSAEAQGLVQLLERLRARLGYEQVQQLSLVEDHRPDHSCVARPADPLRVARGLPSRIDGGVAPVAPRSLPIRQPLWLLREPQPLAERRQQPWLDGVPLQMLCGPERIETGWWDDDPIARDYFIAEAAEGALVWVFRSCKPAEPGVKPIPGWYLQGRFA